MQGIHRRRRPWCRHKTNGLVAARCGSSSPARPASEWNSPGAGRFAGFTNSTKGLGQQVVTGAKLRAAGWEFPAVDANYRNVREAGQIVSVAVTMAVGVNGDGRSSCSVWSCGASRICWAVGCRAAWRGATEGSTGCFWKLQLQPKPLEPTRDRTSGTPEHSAELCWRRLHKKCRPQPSIILGEPSVITACQGTKSTAGEAVATASPRIRPVWRYSKPHQACCGGTLSSHQSASDIVQLDSISPQLDQSIIYSCIPRCC